MNSKKTAKSKRANPPREFTRTKEFKIDWQRLAHSDRYDLKGLKELRHTYMDRRYPDCRDAQNRTIHGA